MIFNNSFKDKNIVVTGHTGFKGVWLTAWLKLLGAKVTGISIDVPTNPSHFDAIDLSTDITDLRIDIRDANDLQDAILDAQPDYLFHLAAQPLVRESYEDPLSTWNTNLFGTLHVLEALRKLKSRCAAVIITSDKCYDNVEWVWGYKESDSLGGPDPYSASKGAAELAIRSYIKSYFPSETSPVRIAAARAGNVIGGGDWAADRIVPDCVKAWSNDTFVDLRNPFSTRPWQHVLEPLSGYLNLAIDLGERLELHGEPFNFGPKAQQNHSVLQLVQEMSAHWEKVRWQDVSASAEGPYESGLLKLNCDKALHYLGWHAVMGFEDTIRMTAEWYKEFYSGSTAMAEFTNRQISEYTDLARDKGLKWSL